MSQYFEIHPDNPQLRLVRQAVDIIRDGAVCGVVNTVTGERAPLIDGFQIRRAAAEKRIPCFTYLDTIRATVEALVGGTHTFSVQPLTGYLT